MCRGSMVAVAVGLVTVREQFVALAATEMTNAKNIPRVDRGLEFPITHCRAAMNNADKQLRYALRARTAGRSAGVGRRRAPAGSVATATVLPVMSKNSIE